MWGYLAGPYLAASLLLIAAGLPKLRDPTPLARALLSARIRADRRGARLLAVGEVALGGWALVAPSRLTAALVAAAYLVFTAFVLVVLTRGGVLSSCGCFGKPDTPPTRTHLAITAGIAAAAALVAVDPPAELWWRGAPSADLTLVAGYAAVLAFLLWQAMAVLPTLSPAAVRGARRG